MADYQANIAKHEAAGISIYALSTDNEEDARKMVDEEGLTYPVIYGVNGAQLTEVWGTYYEEKRNILQPSSYIINPEGKLLSGTSSTGPVGRLESIDVLKVVEFYSKKAS